MILANDLISAFKAGDLFDHHGIISRNKKTYSLIRNRIYFNNILFATIHNDSIKLSFAAIMDDATFSVSSFTPIHLVGSLHVKLNTI